MIGLAEKAGILMVMLRALSAVLQSGARMLSLMRFLIAVRNACLGMGLGVWWE